MNKTECVTPLTLGHFWVVAETFGVSPLLMHPASPPLPSPSLLASSVEVLSCCPSGLCSPLLSAWRGPFCLWLSSAHRLTLRCACCTRHLALQGLAFLPLQPFIQSLKTVSGAGVLEIHGATYRDKANVTKMRSTNPFGERTLGVDCTILATFLWVLSF